MKRLLGLPVVAALLAFVFVLPAAAQGPTVMVATDPALGKILVDGKGMTLYLYSRDTKGVSNCYDACETRWPILRPGADGKPTGSADVGGPLSTITRRDGTMQVTYNDIPLYYFQADEKAGDTKGQASGNVWWVLAPGANQIPPPPAASPSPAPAAPAAAPSAPAAAQPSPAAKPAAQPAQAPAPAPAAKPAASPAPAQAPAALPRTGGTPLGSVLLVFGTGAAGVLATAFGARVLRRGRRRQ
jgi:predicted lipoprotein with Yx(FWY)xxD motif